MSRVAIVAALEREVKRLIKVWELRPKEHGGYAFRFFEGQDIVVVCGGIGTEPARRAAEAVMAIYSPAIVYSVGFAGALEPGVKAGDVFQPSQVINAGDGSRVSLSGGNGILVSFGAVAGPEQKAKLRDSYSAQLVDMEAAAVARAAQVRGVAFGAVKAISDEFDFAFPAMERFVSANGRFLEARFALFAALRPWLWWKVWRLASNSNRASEALCDRLINSMSPRIQTASNPAPGAMQRQ